MYLPYFAVLKIKAVFFGYVWQCKQIFISIPHWNKFLKNLFSHCLTALHLVCNTTVLCLQFPTGDKTFANKRKERAGIQTIVDKQTNKKTAIKRTLNEEPQMQNANYDYNWPPAEHERRTKVNKKWPLRYHKAWRTINQCNEQQIKFNDSRMMDQKTTDNLLPIEDCR